jgi:cell division protease FtsH
MARLAVMLGGRTAEEIAIGDITTGAENDLIEATSLARRMVTRWGMGNLGLAAFKSDDHQPWSKIIPSRRKFSSEKNLQFVSEL